VTLDNQLVVLSTQQTGDNGKTFRATASNSYTQLTSDTTSFLLTVGPPSPSNTNSDTSLLEIVVPPRFTTAVQGDDAMVRMECVANARTLNYLSIRWYNKSSSGVRTQIIPDNFKYLLSIYRRVLTVRNPSVADSGVYQCEASYSNPGSTSSAQTVVAEANLSVYVKPSIVVPPPAELERDILSTVVIQCQAIGTPAPNVAWYRNTVLIGNGTADGRYSILPNGSLRIFLAAMADSAMFQCFVTNTAGQANAATWLKIVSLAPVVSSAPQNQSVVSGEGVKLSCVVGGAPRPLVVWSRVTSANQNEVLRTTINGHIQVPIDLI